MSQAVFPSAILEMMFVWSRIKVNFLKLYMNGADVPEEYTSEPLDLGG